MFFIKLKICLIVNFDWVILLALKNIKVERDSKNIFAQPESLYTRHKNNYTLTKVHLTMCLVQFKTILEVPNKVLKYRKIP